MFICLGQFMHISSWVADWIRLGHPLGKCLNSGWQDHRRCIMCPCFSLPDFSSWCYLMPIYLFTKACKIVVLYFYQYLFHLMVGILVPYLSFGQAAVSFLQERQHLFLIPTIYLSVFKFINWFFISFFFPVQILLKLHFNVNIDNVRHSQS